MKSLQKNWNYSLNKLFRETEYELVISSPYISMTGTKFLMESISRKFKESGVLTFVTDLSPKNICQGSTDPNSFKMLFNSLNSISVYHLPRLHAKVYISDSQKGIITSGNLTAGGLYNNFEYGLLIESEKDISFIKNDILSYGKLGALIDNLKIESYCSRVAEILKAFNEKDKFVKKEIQENFEDAIRVAEIELVAAKLNNGPVHTVFEKTIYYLLKKNASLTTNSIHKMIGAIHPDLCDNEVDRIINNVHFGKKWKHAVRTAQQNLKKKGIIELVDGNWKLS